MTIKKRKLAATPKRLAGRTVLLFLLFITVPLTAQENSQAETHESRSQPKEATSISIQAKPGAADVLAEFLASGAAVVRKTEPQTLQWVAQREGDDRFRIVDFFSDETGRAAHFAGSVAAALKKRSPELVKSGWNKGVVAQVSNSRVLSSVVRAPAKPKAKNGKTPLPKLGCYIQITAKSGKEEALAAFLKGGAAIVQETEPGTVLWYAIRLNESTFAIYDVFVDEAARDAHFQGKVAAALKESAATLVEGGWDQGVVSNVVHADILSITY